jgi:hypothetical protein
LAGSGSTTDAGWQRCLGWIRQAELHAQIEITRELVALQARTLAITEQRHRAGGISEYEVRSQRTTLAQMQASLPLLEYQLDTVNHQLAVLMGKTPAEARVEEIGLEQLNLPRELPASLPSSLVRQRPDIRAAEALLHQACANVGVATANLYPQVDLSASAGAIGTSFTDGGPIWDFGAQLTQPVFKGGAFESRKNERPSLPTRRLAAPISRRCFRLSGRWRTCCAPLSTMPKPCMLEARLRLKLKARTRLHCGATMWVASVRPTCW